MTQSKRIAILTGGGDVPGLNAVIKSVVYRATEVGHSVLGIRRGWEGLTHLRVGENLDPDYIRPLDRINTRTIERTGGTILHTSRTNPRKMRPDALPSWMSEPERESYAVGDGLYDLTHSRLFTNPGVPGWYPATGWPQLSKRTGKNIARNVTARTARAKPKWAVKAEPRIIRIPKCRLN